MLATFCLLGLSLGVSQTSARPLPAKSEGRADWVLTPRLVRGQELVYRGTFTEQAGSRVQFTRGHRFETRIFVLNLPPRSVELAAMTTLADRTPTTATVRDTPVTSAHLERIRLELSGKVGAAPDVPLTVPLEGPPAIEVGMFLELPRVRPEVGQGWEVGEQGRPPIAWQIVGNENVAGHSCLKLVGEQLSDDWERPRADRGAWRRVETMWVSPRSGIAARVERVIEHREPARRDIARMSMLRYELDSDMTYPARLADDRRQEILQTFTLRESARPMLVEPGKFAKQIPVMQKRVTAHLDGRPPTPYREAALSLRRQLDAAGRGEVVVQPIVHETARPSTAVAVGQQAPDFVATDMTGPGSGRLSRYRGKAVLLVFYHPASQSAPELLRFAQEVQAGLASQAQVLGLSVCDDATAVLKQRTALGVTFPVLHGGGMRIGYGVDSTPRLVIVDAGGVLRWASSGWGSGTADEVMTELRKWLPTNSASGGR